MHQIETTQQFLTFHLPPNLKAMLSTQELLEIISLPLSQIVPIADMPPQVMGVCNWRGEVLWLADLAYLLGAEPLFSQGYRQTNYSVLVVQDKGISQIGSSSSVPSPEQNPVLGLVVDQVNQMRWCDPAEIQSVPAHQLTPELAAYLGGYWVTPEGETLLVLSGKAIVNSFLV